MILDNNAPLPVGKLPADLLARLLAQSPASDPRVLLGPGIGLDCAVLDFDSTLLVLKSDPITFATDEIGWYAVQVNANDIATSGADPRWMMVTLLLPEGQTTVEYVEGISRQLQAACRAIGVSIIGGHTEITYGLDRPIILGVMIGEVSRERLVTPRGAAPGDHILLTKGVPIEATALLAREFPERLEGILQPDEINQAREFLYQPGISVLADARYACRAGRVTAMHDPTEGGLLAALWEMAEACGHAMAVDFSLVTIPPLARRVCEVFGIDPLAAIASGALLLTAVAEDAAEICLALESEGIPCTIIGRVEAGSASVISVAGEQRQTALRPTRDEIAKVF